MLGIFLVILTLATLGTFANHELEDVQVPIYLRLFINYFPYYFVIVAGPSAYFHSKALLDKAYEPKRVDRLHFLPALLELVPFFGAIILVIQSAIDQIPIPDDGIFKPLQAYQRYMELPRIISLMIYMVLTWNLLRIYRHLKATSAYRWVRVLVIFGGGIICLFFMDLVIFFTPLYETIGKPYKLEVYTIYYPIVGFIYLLSARLIFRQAPWYLSSDLSDIWNHVVADKDLLSNEKQKRLEKLNSLILDHIDDSNLTIEMIAYELNASRSKAISLIKELTGETPLAYVKSIRMEYIAHLIKSNKVKNASEAAKAIGMSNSTQFATQFEKRFERKPFE